MYLKKYLCLSTMLMLLWIGAVSGAPGVKVVYPDWFKQSFYDLKDDLQEAVDEDKQGLAVFFSEKSCSYCKAMVERTFGEADIAQSLNANFDVVGLDVFSDLELVDTKGNAHLVKDFAVQERAQFTPTMVFYDKNGDRLLRVVGYQPPKKMRFTLDYLNDGHYTRMTLRDYIKQHSSKPTASHKSQAIDLQRDKSNAQPVLVIVESPDCEKCQQFRTMLKAPVMQPYLDQMQLAFVRSSVEQKVITPEGKSLDGKAWADQLGLLHSPSMVYFDKHGNEALRVDFDILIDPQGHSVSTNHPRILDNIRARLEYMTSKGYESIPQFQRWRAGAKKQAASASN